MNNLFSIIIPTFNRSRNISKSIESVLAQTAENWELLIIDDGSTDGTVEMVKKYLTDPRIRYYFQKNLGVSAARNKGIAECTGDFLVFLDSDDLLRPELISKLNSIHINYMDIVFWRVKKLFEHKRAEIWKPRKLGKVYNGITASFLAGSACYRKSLILRAGGFDAKLQFGENYELGMRIAQIEGINCVVLDEIFLIYNVKLVRNHSLPEKKIKSLLYLSEKHKSIYEQDLDSYSTLLYQIGYLSEKMKRRSEAREFYSKSWKLRPVYLKAFLKMLQLKWL